MNAIVARLQWKLQSDCRKALKQRAPRSLSPTQLEFLARFYMTKKLGPFFPNSPLPYWPQLTQDLRNSTSRRLLGRSAD